MKCVKCEHRHSNINEPGVVICDNDCGTFHCMKCNAEFHYNDNTLVMGHKDGCGK